MTRVAVVQFDPQLGQIEANLAQMVHALKRADAPLTVFPECAVTGYGFDSLAAALAVAQTIPGPATESMVAACRATQSVAVVGMLERVQDRVFNAAALVGPSGVLGRYRKMHLPYLGVDRFVTPGDLGFPVFDLEFGKLGLLICYDLSFPEAARVLKLRGAQAIAVSTNWPEAAQVSCHQSPYVRAQENHVNVITANRIGSESGFAFLGHSRIVDFHGTAVAQAARDATILRADIDFAGADRNRVVNVPGQYEVDRLADRRPEFYGPLVS